MSPRKMFAIGIVVVVVIFGLATIFQTIQWLPANKMMVMQSVRTGHLTCNTEPGPYLRLFATVTAYNKRTTLWFSSRKDQGKATDEALPTPFQRWRYGQDVGRRVL